MIALWGKPINTLTFTNQNVSSPPSCCCLPKMVGLNKNTIILFHFYRAVQCLLSQWTCYSSFLNGNNKNADVKSSVYLPIIREEGYFFYLKCHALLHAAQTLRNASIVDKQYFPWILHVHDLLRTHYFIQPGWNSCQYLQGKSRQAEHKSRRRG